MHVQGAPIHSSVRPVRNAAIRFVVIFVVFAVFDSLLTAAVRVGMDSGLPREFVFWNNLYAYRFFIISENAILFAVATIYINNGSFKKAIILDIIFSAACGLYYAFMFHPYRLSRDISSDIVRPAFKHTLALEEVDFASHFIEGIAPFVVLALITGSYRSWRWPRFRIRRAPATRAAAEDLTEDIR
jgi:hypothetical protein